MGLYGALYLITVTVVMANPQIAHTYVNAVNPLKNYEEEGIIIIPISQMSN